MSITDRHNELQQEVSDLDREVQEILRNAQVEDMPHATRALIAKLLLCADAYVLLKERIAIEPHMHPLLHRVVDGKCKLRESFTRVVNSEYAA